MKKQVFISILLLLAVPMLAQEKYFREAIQRGPTANGFYCINNTSKKNITVGELSVYAERMGYAIGRIATTELSRFGDTKTIVYKFEFLTADKFDAYVFRCLSNAESVKPLPNTKGTAFFLPINQVKKWNPYSSSRNSDNNSKTLKRYDNVVWTGQITNGLLHGTGKGLFKQGNLYYYISGNFSYGFPSEKPTIKTATKASNQKKASPNGLDVNAMETPAVTPRFLASLTGITDSKLKEAANLAVKDDCNKAVKKLDESYRKALAINKTNYAKASYDKYPEEFCATYKNIADAKTMEKAREIADFVNIVYALQIPVHVHFIGSNSSLARLFGAYEYTWDQQTWDSFNNTLTKANNGMKRLKANSKYGFKNFCIQTEGLLKKQNEVFAKSTQEGRAEFAQLHGRETAERAARDAKRNAGNTKHSLEIDWDRSKKPSGDIPEHNFLFHRTSYENSGSIYFKSGSENVTYNVYFYDGEFDYYKITYASSKIREGLKKWEFKSEVEMYEAILNALRQ
jgi:hypothetical protein